MNSALPEALRLILPWLFRIASVDFLGADGFLEAVFGLDDEDRCVDEERDDSCPPFCAVTGNGSTRAITIRATPIRFNIVNLPVSVGIIEGLKEGGKLKRTACFRSFRHNLNHFAVRN